MKQKVRLGIDVLLRDGLWRDRKIGLVTNHSGITSAGVPTWRALLDAGYQLAAIFGPEHGFRGEAQDGVTVGADRFRGIPVHSLFGGQAVKPTPEMLKGIDVLLYDIQDVGCRFYTYLFTLAQCMEACGEAGVRFAVLDRPNPIGAHVIEGGPIVKEWWSLVGAYGLPERTGVTVGEYARYVQREYLPKASLEVVAMQGYRRTMPYRETGLPWVAPSPNLPTIECAVVYPGTCLFEGTTASEGRGTTRPFETIGAAWIDGEKLREALAALSLEGVIFCSTFFVPTISKFKGESCQGVVLHVTDVERFRPLYTALAMFWVLKRDYPAAFTWKPDWEGSFSFLDRLAGGPWLREMLDHGAGIAELYGRACQDQAVYLEKRKRSLLYR